MQIYWVEILKMPSVDGIADSGQANIDDYDFNTKEMNRQYSYKCS